MLLKPTLVLLLLLKLALAAFTHSDRICWRRDCIIRTDAGTLCFEPHDNGIVAEQCTDVFLNNLTRNHLKSTIDRSIIYYDDKARVLGAATWAIPPSMTGSVFVCMTGRRMDDSTRYRTVCRAAHSDDDMEIAAAHANECVSDKKPQYVSDGCFSLGKPSGGDDEHKEWYEQPVVAGFFWVLGGLVTLGSLYLWGGKAARAIQVRLPRRLAAHADVIEQLVRNWRRPLPPLPTQHPAMISEYPYTSGTIQRAEMFALTDRSAAQSSGLAGEEANRD